MPVLLLRHLDKRTQWKAVTGDSFTLGFSETATVPVPDDGLAAREVKVTKTGDRYLLRDLAEKDRVLLNGVVAREGLLKDGDQLEIGRIAVLFLDDAPAPGEIRFFPGEQDGDLEGDRWDLLEAAASAPRSLPDEPTGHKPSWRGVPLACLLGTFVAGVAFGVLGLRSPTTRGPAPRPPPAEPTFVEPNERREGEPAGAANPAPPPPLAAAPGNAGPAEASTIPPPAPPEPPASTESATAPPAVTPSAPGVEGPRAPGTTEAATLLPEPAGDVESRTPAAKEVGAEEAAEPAAPRVLLIALSGTLATDELSPHSRSAARTLWEIALAGVTVTRVDFSSAASPGGTRSAVELRDLLWSAAARPPDLLEADRLPFHVLRHLRGALIPLAAESGTPEDVAARDALLRRIIEAAGSEAHVIVVAIPRTGEGAVFARGPLLRSGWVIDQSRTSAIVRALVGRTLGKVAPDDPTAKEALELFQ
jgi:hypothetical protein